MSDQYVFISYSRHDKHVVDRLAEDLRSGGVRVWRDVEQIAAGTNWQHQIMEGISNATALLYILSENSARSEWTKAELQAFYSRNQRVIPIIVDDVELSEIPLFLRTRQWVDLRSDYENGVKAILSALGSDIATTKPVETKPKQSKGYVFLSYAEEDSDFVQRLKGFLRENGYAYWDYDESDRDYHSQLFLELEGVIGEAIATLSILSEAWKRSPWTVKEYFFSEEVRTPVFLLKAKQIGPTLAIAGIPYIDLVSDTDRGFEKLRRELQRKGL